MLEEVSQPSYKSFMFPCLSNCQKSHIDSIIIFWNFKKKKKKNLSNWGLSVTCFKCKPACLEHPHRSSDSMLKLEDWSICQRQKNKTKNNKTKNKKQQQKNPNPKMSPEWFKNKWNYIWNESNDLTRVQDMLFSFYSRQNQLQNITSALVLGVCVHQLHLFSPTWISWRAWSSRRFLQASASWPPSSGFFQVGRIAYSYNLPPGSARLIFITSIILYNKYSNPDPKSRA